MPWRVYAASAIGKQHIDVGLPCQDAFAFDRVGEWLIAVVADGAGSAAHSERGSVLCAHTVVSNLAGRATEAGSGDWCSADIFPDVVQTARAALQAEAEASGWPLQDLACTLVGAVLSSSGGWLFHIGDGMAAIRTLDGIPVVSLPENGEFANETWFVTADDWLPHLRCTPVTTVSCLAMMSDGAMPFVMNKARTDLFSPFFDPVSRYLLGVDEATGNEALAGTLDDPRTWNITGDDKTLLLAFFDSEQGPSSVADSGTSSAN
jgi:hypothetical protein